MTQLTVTAGGYYGSDVIPADYSSFTHWTMTPDLWTLQQGSLCRFPSASPAELSLCLLSVSVCVQRWRGDSCWCPTPPCTAVGTWNTVSSTSRTSSESKCSATAFIHWCRFIRSRSQEVQHLPGLQENKFTQKSQFYMPMLQATLNNESFNLKTLISNIDLSIFHFFHLFNCMLSPKVNVRIELLKCIFLA